MRRLFVYGVGVLLAVVLISGCTASYDLTKSKFATQLKGSGKLAIAVQDQRSFIVDKTKPPAYIGQHPNGGGIMRDAVTRSGKPLAEDMSAILSPSFVANGFQVTRFAIPTSADNPGDVVKQQAAGGYDKIIVLTINKFRSDSWVEVELQWDLKMSVYDGKGELLAEKESAGMVEGLKRNFTGALSNGQVQKALSDKLGLIFAELINSPECQKAIVTL